MADENELGVNIKGDASGAEAASKAAAGAVGKVSKEARELEAAFRRLQQTINPAFAAQEKYNRALADADRLLKAQKISKEQANAAIAAAKSAYDAEVAAIQRNSTEGRAAAAALAAAKKQQREQELADTKAAAAAERQEAQKKRAAEIQASKDAAAAERAAKAQAREAAAEAAKAAAAEAQAKKKAERQATQEALDAEKAAKAETRRLNREAAQAARDEAAAKRAAAKIAKQAADEAAEATRRAARAERDAAEAVRELRGSIDPLYAAQERYNDVMARATSLLMQGRLQAGEWTKIQQQAKAQMDINTRSMGRLNSVYVQMGYQAQDVTASLASGINPLVILAQQGGQTAAALTMMGGTVGKVASFFAGPWGAAIIGATMLLGLYIQKNKESEKTTKDVMNAEDRRRMTLQELTDALREYNEEQERKNRNETAQRAADIQGAQGAIGEASKRVSDLEKALAKAKKGYDALMANPTGEGADMAIILAGNEVRKLTQDLATARRTEQTARSALYETQFRQNKAIAEGLTDEREAIQQRYRIEEDSILRVARAKVAAANQNLSGPERQKALDSINREQVESLTQAIRRRQAAEKALNDEKGRSRREAAEERKEYREAKGALEDEIAGLTFKQTLAGEDLAESIRIQDTKIAKLKAFYGAESKEAKDAMRERVLIERRQWEQINQQQQAGIDTWLAGVTSRDQAQQQIKESALGERSDSLDLSVSMGGVDPVQELNSRRQLMDALYEITRAGIIRQYEFQKEAANRKLELDNLSKADADRIRNELERAEVEYYNRLGILDAQHHRDVAKNTNDTLAETTRRWRESIGVVGQTLSSNFRGLWTQQMSFQQSMFNIIDNIVYKWVDSGIEIAEAWMTSLIKKQIATQASTAAEVATTAAGEGAKTAAVAAGTAARTGIVVAGAATEEGVTIATTLTSIGASAVKAAAAAYSAIAGIPVVGPFLAPLAAGTALAAVMGFAARVTSAAGGQWQVPYDGQMTELHKDEMVLPAWAAKPLRRSLTAPTSDRAIASLGTQAQGTREQFAQAMTSGGGRNYNIHALDAQSFMGFLNRNPRVMDRAIQKYARSKLGA